jgi:CheY-like chemotaxis protein
MRTVLLVADSDSRQLEHTHSYFATIGFHVERATNGVDCLTILNRVTPHAVLLDANIAWGGAPGVLEVMNGDFALRSLPVVMIESGRAVPQRQCECRPVVARVPRPVNLLQTLMILLEELPEFAREIAQESSPDIEWLIATG